MNAPLIHHTVDIDAPVQVGDGTAIWHYCHLMRDCVIGESCMLGRNVFVASGVSIGSGCRIQNNVSIYRGVTLERDVFIGPMVVFTNVRTPRAFINRQQKFEPTLVKCGASIGANATIICGVTIGKYSLVGAGAVITKDVAPQALVTGVPAVQTGWVCHCGAVLDAAYECGECGDRYYVDGRGLKVLNE